MKVKVNKEKCISCGLCVNMCPDIFELDSDAKSTVKNQPEGKQQDNCVEQSISSCPVEAIYKE
jgi:ferredoxin